MTSPPADCILDASAVLAVLLGEPGQEQVREVLDHCTIHAVNLAEAASKLAQAGVPEAEIRNSFTELAIPVDETFTEGQALACAELARKTRGLGLSLGDRVCLTVAGGTGATVLTADRRWSQVEGPDLRVRMIR
jgi:PIN domain nuclease of toxin-antitoxin system